jgi:hypothetical protein
VIKREAEKILKGRDLTLAVPCMWNVENNLIPVIIAATGR